MFGGLSYIGFEEGVCHRTIWWGCGTIETIYAGDPKFVLTELIIKKDMLAAIEQDDLTEITEDEFLMGSVH